MFKKLFSVFSLGLLVSAGAHAQHFELTEATVEESTPGTAIWSGTGDRPTVDLHTFVRNIHADPIADPITVKWQWITDSTAHPMGWLLAGICDNISCRIPYETWYTDHAAQSTLPFPVTAMGTTQNCLLEARVYAPTSAPDGTGTFKVRVWTFDATDTSIVTQADTATFILIKGPVGIDVIKADDSRVNLHPNPATSTLYVYADRALKTTGVELYNITGRKLSATGFENGKEVTSLNVAHLPAGTYLVRLTDDKGNIVTTRKFIKE